MRVCYDRDADVGLIKVAGTGETRSEQLRLPDIFRGRRFDTSRESFVFELTGATDKLDSFTDLLRPRTRRQSCFASGTGLNVRPAVQS